MMKYHFLTQVILQVKMFILIIDLPIYQIHFSETKNSLESTQEIIIEEVKDENKKRKLDQEIKTEEIPQKIQKKDEKQDELKPDEKQLEKETTETLEDNLICPICFGLFYKTISIVPCLHNFCSACYSDWIQNSNSCPQCRVEIIQVGKNHSMDNLVEIFLKQFPDRKRDENELKEMDQKNIITEEYVSFYYFYMKVKKSKDSIK